MGVIGYILFHLAVILLSVTTQLLVPRTKYLGLFNFKNGSIIERYKTVHCVDMVDWDNFFLTLALGNHPIKLLSRNFKTEKKILHLVHDLLNVKLQ